ncbi:hypothetical protein CB1_000993048 [Camelus ferus]|nr:hypothetical protein CB1_000993048 [Camelus ferus]
MSEQEDETEDDPSVVKDYKDLDKVVQSFRYDVILKTGLDIGRNRKDRALQGLKDTSPSVACSVDLCVASGLEGPALV